MKRKISLIIIVVVVFCMGCEKKPFEKPFVIVSKCKGSCTYVYSAQDKNGRILHFDDDFTKYSIGDTIK